MDELSQNIHGLLETYKEPFWYFLKANDPFDNELSRYAEIFRSVKNRVEIDEERLNEMLQIQRQIGKIHIRIEFAVILNEIIRCLIQDVKSEGSKLKELVQGFKYRNPDPNLEKDEPTVIIYCKSEDIDTVAEIIFNLNPNLFQNNQKFFGSSRFSAPTQYTGIYSTIGDSQFKYFLRERNLLDEFFDKDSNYAKRTRE